MEMNRREVLASLSVFALLDGLFAGQAEAAGLDMAKSVVFQYDQLPVVHNANGGTSRAVMKGTLKTGEFVEVHETTLPAGQMPHPPHRHSHSEFLLIREGNLEFQDEGVPMPVGPGGVVYTASGRLHGLKNTGTTMGSYFVVAVGVQKAEG
jgi:mannose-6-phosphate isomerase-like protein (cupin superfamily)